MGDTVLTEYLLLLTLPPAVGEDKPRAPGTVVFTNGGMVYSMINKRLAQIIITSRFGGAFVRWCPRGVRDWFSRKQLGTIWGGNREGMDKDIEDIMILTDWKGGSEVRGKGEGQRG